MTSSLSLSHSKAVKAHPLAHQSDGVVLKRLHDGIPVTLLLHCIPLHMNHALHACACVCVCVRASVQRGLFVVCRLGRNWSVLHALSHGA